MITEGDNSGGETVEINPIYDWLRGITPGLGASFECGATPLLQAGDGGGKKTPLIKSKEASGVSMNPLRSGSNSPMSPAMSVASTVVPQGPSQKRCASCDSVGDAGESTCQICGEDFPRHTWAFATTWQRTPSSQLLHQQTGSPISTPRTQRRLFEREPVPFDKVVREPMVWQSARMKIRTVDGGCREVEVPMLLNTSQVPPANDEAAGKWM